MGGKELVDMFDKIGFSEEQFRGRETIRLKQLSYLNKYDLINDTLRFIKG